MPELGKSGSVGAPGEQPPGATRLAPGEAWERRKPCEVVSRNLSMGPGR